MKRFIHENPGVFAFICVVAGMTISGVFESIFGR